MGHRAAARVVAVGAALAVYYAVQFASAWAGLQNPWGAPASWHANGQWLYMTVHHAVQALFALALIGVLGGFRWREWGLNLDHRRQSLALVRRFAVGFGAVMAVSLLLQLATGASSIYARPLEPGHVIGGLFFMWIVSGVSEEIVFRGLLQTWFGRFWSGTVVVGGVEVPTAGIAAAALFAVVHIGFSLVPPGVTRFAPMQVALAFVLGILYAIAYHRTGSLLAPALMHCIANGLMETTNLVVALAE